jgi:hypothetical protein
MSARGGLHDPYAQQWGGGVNAFAWLAVFDIACIGAATYLAVNNHPGFAIFLFLMAATTTVTTERKDKDT